MEVGTVVRILPPFDETFPDEYSITEVVENDEGKAYILGDLGGFDAAYLEVVQ